MSTMIKMVRAFTAVAALATAAPAFAAGEVPHIARQQWSFAGPFGTYDRAQLQRGFKIYREVCSSCHSLRLVAFRNLAGYYKNQQSFLHSLTSSPSSCDYI